MNPEDHHIKVLVGLVLDHDLEQDLTKFLQDRKSTLSWKHEDMIVISKDVITQKLIVDLSFRTIH